MKNDNEDIYVSIKGIMFKTENWGWKCMKIEEIEGNGKDKDLKNYAGRIHKEKNYAKPSPNYHSIIS